MHNRALLLSLTLAAACSGGDGPPNPPSGLGVKVGAIFAPGTAVRDAYTGASATVEADGTVHFEPGPEGVILIEAEGAQDTLPAFTWDNAIVYFAIIDRFHNGDPSNDHSYGRASDGEDEIGTWHGGDLAGLTAKLEHIDALGANAIWITAPYEQIHGWVGGGGEGEFKHYGYHGYWALDFTTVDANYGDRAALATFVDAAHARGIRVVLDVVMNHPGYPNAQDMAELGVDVVDPGWATWEPGPNENYFYFDALFDRHSEAWLDWWGRGWIRMTDVGPSGPNAYPSCGNNDLKTCVGYLPDFQTDSTSKVQPPPLFANKPDTRVVALQDATVRDYLISWLTGWVREFGVDGFRCDTAKHVEREAWGALKVEAQAALDAWRAANPAKKLDDLPFWMTGEVFSYSASRDGKNDYFTTGKMDSLINFEFQGKAPSLAGSTDELEALYADYAERLNGDPAFNVLSYISSHDTSLYFSKRAGEDPAAQNAVGTALMLVPGGIQIFYGDETGRRFGPTGSDANQGTRSDMNWDSIQQPILAHWKALGQFRRRHPALAAGAHQKLEGDAYAFARTLGDDAVVVVVTQP
jgi:alpha-amylase